MWAIFDQENDKVLVLGTNAAAADRVGSIR